jgi:adenylate kinase
MAVALERTLALIKPDACGRPWTERVMKKVEQETDDGPVEKWVEAEVERSTDKAAEIIARIEQAGFRIVKQLVRRLTKAQAEAFYAEHRGKAFFDKLTDFMSSGPIVSMILEKENAIKDWRALMGPTNTIKAREAAEAEHPLDETKWSLRALFGTDGTQNATHGSDSPFSAMREAEFFFPEAPAFQRTVAVLLPEAAAREADIVASLERHGFVIIARTDCRFAEAQAASLAGSDSPPAVAKALEAGPCVALVLEKHNAVKQLVLAAGPPAGKAVAKDKAPASLNALYSPGADEGDGVALVAPSTAQAAAVAIYSAFGGPLPVEHTLAVVKPGTADEHGAEILREIASRGFRIAAQKRVQISVEQAEAFYEEHRGKPFFERLTKYMASGPVIAMALVKPGAIKSWRSLMGPTNTFTARLEAPDSLRARFGVDGTRNATHGSDSQASATREIHFYFPDLAPHTLLQGAEAEAFVKIQEVTKVYNPVENNSVSATVRSVLLQGLTELGKHRPEEEPADAIRWLAHWLIDNNPRRGVASESKDDEYTNSGAVVESPRGAASAAAASSMAERVVEMSSELHLGKGGYAIRSSTADSGAARRIVFVLGAPGSGKGTQCERLSKAFGYTHLSTGDLLRDEVKSGSSLGKQLEEVMLSGGLVQTSTVLHLLRRAMEESGNSKFLIDGYPRALDQAFAFEKAVGKPCMVLSFAALEATLEARLVERGKTSGRADDNVESIRKRFKTFTEQSAPVIDFYDKIGLVRSVDSEGKTPEQVFAVASTHFRPKVAFVVGGPASGRSSMCARAAAELGWTHLSTGDLLRDEAARRTELGMQVAELLDRGDLVPAPLTLKVLVSALDRDTGGTGRFLLDGYPRTLEQAALFEEAVGAPDVVVHCTAPDRVLTRRALARVNPKRSDITKAAVAQQLSSYHEKTSKVVELYEKEALVKVVDTNQPMEGSYQAFRQSLTPQVYFVLGGPGSGKGTQCVRLKEEFGFCHLSAGDLLRAESSRGSAVGDMIDKHIRDGTIVPVSTTLGLLKDAMRLSGAARFLIDGFPRATDQAEGYEEVFGLPNGVLFFDCPEATMRSRLLERGKTSGRSDDNEATILKRFNTFHKESMPVIHKYARQGLVLPVDSTAPVDSVYAETRAHFLPQTVFVLGGPGSGKGTQCARLKEEFGYTHLSTGDLLRGEVRRRSAVGREMKALMDAGKLVPTETMVMLLRDAMSRSNGRRFLIDGFPRSREQAEVFERLVCQPQFVLFFDCPEATMRSRLLERGKTSGRSDDNEATILKRFHTFVTESMPVIDDYRARGMLHEVSAVPTAPEVYATCRKFFQPELVVLCGATGSGRGEFTSRAGLSLGYETLRVPKLLAQEASHGTERGKALKQAIDKHRTAPVKETVEVIREAIAKSRAHRFILDGFPRLVSEGFPSVHDQVFALEEGIGPVRGCVCLDAHVAQRKARIQGAPTVGKEAALIHSVDVFRREKLPVVTYFSGLGKSLVVDTTPAPDAVFESASPFLE